MTLEEQIAQTIRDNCDEPEVESIFAAAKAVVGLLRQGPTIEVLKWEDAHYHTIAWNEGSAVKGTYALVLLEEEDVAEDEGYDPTCSTCREYGA